VIQLRTDYKVGHEIAQRQYGAAAPSLHRPAAPRTINVDTVRVIEAGRSFSYRDARYVIEKIDWWDGCVLEYLVDTIILLLKEQVTRSVLGKLAVHYEEVAALMWRNVRPVSRFGLWRRWVSPRWNPFLSMTNAEFSALVDFYSECRKRLPDLALDTTPGSHSGRQRLRSISQMRMHNLFGSSPP
jgi:hypothetical protein